MFGYIDALKPPGRPRSFLPVIWRSFNWNSVLVSGVLPSKVGHPAAPSESLLGGSPREPVCLLATIETGESPEPLPRTHGLDLAGRPVPQDAQTRPRRAPHSRQNFEPGRFSCWHRGHCI